MVVRSAVVRLVRIFIEETRRLRGLARGEISIQSRDTRRHVSGAHILLRRAPLEAQAGQAGTHGMLPFKHGAFALGH